MLSFRSQPGSSAALVRLLHLWRAALLCAAITHERHHPGLAILVLIPLNHLLFSLTAGLDPSAGVTPPSRARPWRRAFAHTPVPRVHAAIVVGIYLVASGLVLWWYGSLAALVGDVQAFGRTWELWAVAGALIALTALYRPLLAELHQLLGATGLRNARLWRALVVALAVWLWCDGVFAGLYQQLSLLCADVAPSLCDGRLPFSQSLARYADAAYFSTITLSTTGYGDIVPVSDVARVIVAAEIMIGYGLLGFLLSRVAGLAAPPSSDSGVDGTRPDPGGLPPQSEPSR